MSAETTTQPIALALSGGGIRAMAFHLGVLRFMAERGMLESTARISSVSGGSLVIGLIFHEAGMRWPSSADYLSHVYPALRAKLCARSLQWGALRQLANPLNLRFLLSRANLLALVLTNEWNIVARLADLPQTPEWSINGTTAESGKRFRFKQGDLGDYTLGYATPGNFPLANALAVSAAFPGGFGALTFDATRFEWRKRAWDDAPQAAEVVNIDYKRLHLYDGGVYDNLGLEPFFDAGRIQLKHAGHYLVVSDAGAPLPSGFSLGPLNPFRLKRVADIMSDQAHALRVRTFSSYLQQGADRGAFVYIAMPLADTAPCPSAKYAASFPTTLRRLTLTEFDRLADHGCNVSRKVERLYGFGPRATASTLTT
ncbi:MAG: patatin-like phospholipase family protein [Burkholderiales bacterium]|nr:patatin-like phospholipase family protein [Burkholderiales bacterium]